MHRGRSLVCLVPLLTACAAVSPASNVASDARTSASPAASPLAGPAYAVLVDDRSLDSTYGIAVAAIGGGVVARAHATKRPMQDNWLDLPYVSTTSKSLYYLDAGSAVMELPLDGSVARTIGQLPAAINEELEFSVSPDESEIAVSVIDFNRSPAHVTLYVGAFPALVLQKIFQSDSDYVWPVAWHGGLLVLAHAYGAYQDVALKAAPSRDNPYWAVSYHLVDPANADRVVLMGSCTVSGPLSPAGSACIQGGAIDWHGNTTTWSTHDWGAISAAASISPDGSLIAAADPDHPENLDFWRPGGAIATWVEGPGPQEWAGWIDDTHVFIPATSKFPPRILTLSQGPSAAAFIDASGFYAARLPTDIT